MDRPITTRGSAQAMIDKRDADYAEKAAAVELQAKAAAIAEEIDRDFDTALAMVVGWGMHSDTSEEIHEEISSAFYGVRCARVGMENYKDEAISAMCEAESKKRAQAEKVGE